MVLIFRSGTRNTIVKLYEIADLYNLTFPKNGISSKICFNLLLDNVEAEVLEEKVAQPLVEDLVKVDLPRLLQVLDHHRPWLIFWGILSDLISGIFSSPHISRVPFKYVVRLILRYIWGKVLRHIYVSSKDYQPHTWVRQDNLFARAGRWKKR